MAIYSIETKDDYNGMMYRFHSLFNGAVGCWCNSKESADKEGVIHQELIEEIYFKKEDK